MEPIRDELVDIDYAKLEERLAASEPGSNVIVIGAGYNDESIRWLLAGKVPGHQYTVLTHAEAGERGLLQGDIGEPVRLLNPPAPSWRQPTWVSGGGRGQPHPERDAWNAAVDQRKADKRRAKGK